MPLLIPEIPMMIPEMMIPELFFHGTVNPPATPAQLSLPPSDLAAWFSLRLHRLVDFATAE